MEKIADQSLPVEAELSAGKFKFRRRLKFSLIVLGCCLLVVIFGSSILYFSHQPKKSTLTPTLSVNKKVIPIPTNTVNKNIPLSPRGQDLLANKQRTPTPTITVDKKTSRSPNGQYSIEQSCNNSPYVSQLSCTYTLTNIKNKTSEVLYSIGADGYYHYYLGNTDVWSPDSKYFELLFTGGGVDQLIFKSDGSVFPDGKRYISVGGLVSNYLKTNVETNSIWVSGDKMCVSPFTNVYLSSYILDLSSLTFQKNSTSCSK